jgi:hypothetical protein
MAVAHSAYPVLEIGRTLGQDHVLVARTDLAIALTCVQAMQRGFMFRLSIISDHEVEPVESFRFGRAETDGTGLDLWLAEVGVEGTEHISNLHLQGGGGGGSRYDFQFWAPVEDDSQHASVVVSWPREGVPPVSAAVDLEAVRRASTNNVKIAGPEITYP